MNDTAAIIALAGLLATFSIIMSSILVYHALYTQRELDKLREIVRSLGLRIGAPINELPPERPVIDEYAPGASFDDDGSFDREWRLPPSLRRN